jgi:hypothetical protein
MMRFLMIALAAVLVMSFGPRFAQANEGPWCASITVGTGAVYDDCQYYSLEACRPHILAGNRGFCNLNPRWVGSTVKPHVRHRQHVRRD